MLAAVKIFASDLVVREGEEAVVVQQHVDQVGELALVARGEEAVTDHVNNLHNDEIISFISNKAFIQCSMRLNSVINAKVVVASFNQEKALVAFFSMIVQL